MTTQSAKAAAASNPVQAAKDVARASAPRIKARSRGHMSELLEGTAAAFRAANPGKDVRYVYDPATSPQTSKRLKRLAQGYVPVKGSELGIENPFGSQDDVVRVGDLTLMSIDAAQKEELRAELAEAAKQELNRINPAFHNAVSGIEVSGASGSHVGRPIGSVTMQEQEREINVDQRTSGE